MFLLQADQAFLQELKETQDRVQLSDEIAQEVVREAARAKLERCLGTALDAMKKRTRVRDYSPAVQVGLLRELRSACVGSLWGDSRDSWGFLSEVASLLDLLYLGQKSVWRH